MQYHNNKSLLLRIEQVKKIKIIIFKEWKKKKKIEYWTISTGFEWFLFDIWFDTL